MRRNPPPPPARDGARSAVEAGSRPEPSLVRAASAACRRGRLLAAGRPRGGALQTRSGRIHTGCDLSAPPSTGLALCAERAAVAHAVLAGETHYLSLVLRGGRDGREDAGPPCGGCLQVLAEFSPEVRIFWGSASDPRGGQTARELLPATFQLGPERVRKHDA